MRLSLVETLGRLELEQIAQNIKERCRGNSKMIEQAIQAAESAANGIPQNLFPQDAPLGPQAYMDIAEILRRG